VGKDWALKGLGPFRLRLRPQVRYFRKFRRKGPAARGPVVPQNLIRRVEARKLAGTVGLVIDDFEASLSSIA
jgi:hypothetical protein